MRFPVGAAVRRFDLLAKIVNDNAGRLTPRGALRFFASKSNRRTAAPTGIAFILLLGIPGLAHAFDLQQLSDQLAKPTVIHGNFIQEKHLRALPQPLTSKGTFVLAKDHGLLWLLKTPLQQDYRISANGIARRDANGWQLLPNKSAGAEQNRLFLAVLQGDSSGLQRDFELQLQGEAQQWKLTLIPRSLLLKQVFTQINIDGGELVQKIELLETQGDSTVLRMQDSTSSQPLSDAEQHDFAE
ncbi:MULTISPECIES: outer membrane lipoprotein carrier protein LolA [unclassified Pseudomonas]|uniref:outer membrane lipoprotein carrier protein LolA n=1 Tax=unclassified Pseudomonas TaxID=196821 RepID=UPI0015A2A9E3|nr:MULTISPECIES: outer membrane lipoprotein carrier protein LolA [unclassified Pseudomonas]NWB58581.1 outer membrane lipoprotein carrier protein LolA [Pseudomonas sp. F1002]NWC04725.1 outer membrane lipoprotein carrier protein LolA [Pseudomonas sp. G1002]